MQNEVIFGQNVRLKSAPILQTNDYNSQKIDRKFKIEWKIISVNNYLEDNAPKVP